ncbi:TIR domain-containing protein [Streptomyces sp. NPDC058914]|uniref:TIR domain-containing protein n=1 Tax=Streptomyces TaxID=1883 RepID=UPI0036B0215D
MNDAPVWFFTSYSELHNKRPYVKRFHQDVEDEVRALLGRRTPGSGFVDVRNLRPGDRWRFRIQDGVCQARTMLALYSASYFDSEWCAREWTVFEERRRRHRTAGGASPHLVGVVWRRGPRSWPEVVRDDEYLRGAAESRYEKHGLFHLVPDGDERGCEEYVGIVRDVAGQLADAIHKGDDLPCVSLVEARELTPLFGPDERSPVNIVISYADQDVQWATWAAEQLEREGRSVALEAVEAGDGPVERVRQALRRADRVLVLVSGAYFSGGMTREALDTALSDGSSDWQRLVPVFVEPSVEDELPSFFRRLARTALQDLDEGDARNVVVKASTQLIERVTQPPRQRAAFPGRPAAGAPAGEKQALVAHLVNALLTADSVTDDAIRPIWLAQTGLDLGSLNQGIPLRAQLFALIALAATRSEGCTALADALDALEPGSPAAGQVRRAVERLAAPPQPPADPTALA